MLAEAEICELGVESLSCLCGPDAVSESFGCKPLLAIRLGVARPREPFGLAFFLLLFGRPSLVGDDEVRQVRLSAIPVKKRETHRSRVGVIRQLRRCEVDFAVLRAATKRCERLTSRLACELREVLRVLPHPRDVLGAPPIAAVPCLAGIIGLPHDDRCAAPSWGRQMARVHRRKCASSGLEARRRPEASVSGRPRSRRRGQAHGAVAPDVGLPQRLALSSKRERSSEARGLRAAAGSGATAVPANDRRLRHRADRHRRPRAGRRWCNRRNTADHRAPRGSSLRLHGPPRHLKLTTPNGQLARSTAGLGTVSRVPVPKARRPAATGTCATRHRARSGPRRRRPRAWPRPSRSASRAPSRHASPRCSA